MGTERNDSESEPEESLKRSMPTDELESSTGRKKKKLDHPSIKELMELNEAKRSVKSFFRLQIQKLLEETEIKNKYRKQLTSWVNEFQKFENSDNIFSQTENSKFFKSLKKKLNKKLCCDHDFPITFVKPEVIDIFGLYKINAFPGPHIEANLHVTIPRKCLNVKDYLNNRYFIKKYYYLMYIAEYLQRNNMCSSIKYAYYNENILLPYLILTPINTDKITVKLFLVPEQNYFKNTRYSPEVNNVKTQLFEQDYGSIDDIGELPTTYYNVALAFDASLVENHVFMEKIFSSSQSIQEGIKLIVIWMNQRKLYTGSGGFSNDLAVYFIVYLVSRGHLNKSMTAQQVFRNFLYFIYTTDLTRTPLSICEEISEEVLQKYKAAFDIVLMDRMGYYNTAAFLNINTYLKMRNECKLALDNLDHSDSNSFTNLFLTKIPIHLQFDAFIDIKNENNYEFLLGKVSFQEKAKYLGNYKTLVIKNLLNYLNKGFNKRVMNIVPLMPSCNECDYKENFKKTGERILFGIQLNPDLAFEILEYGPVLNDPEEENFKEFWGDLSSNRRFRDGTAKIVVYFETNTMKAKRDIIQTITNYVMGEKLQLNHKFYYNELEEVLLNKKIETWYPFGTNEETSLRIIKLSDDLGQKIRSLSLKLGISGIGGISDVFCYTNVYPPLPTSYICGKKITTLKEHNIILKDKRLNACPKYVEPVECVIQLAHSSKWPGDLNKLQHMKTAFLIHISDLLKKQFDIVSTVTPPYLDILFGGIVFRYALHLSKEIALLKRDVDDNGSKVHNDNNSSLDMEKKFIVVPKIVGALKGIHAQFSSYGVSTCLAKRWIRAQLIDDFLFPDMVINLLNAHQYVHKYLYNPAVSPQEAFLRFLKFLVEAQWDWQPIVINFNNELSEERIFRLETDMEKNRGNYPDLFILTPYDDNSSFTATAPCKQVLIRLKVLATEFLNYFEKMIMEESLCDWKDLFIPNATGFDYVLNVKYLLNPRRHEALSNNEIDSQITYMEPKENQHMPVIKFDPIQILLKELRNTYGDHCVFFHDTYGGSYIGVLWKPDVPLESKEDIKRGFEIIGKNILKNNK
ncbi:nucleolar protein 6-like [Harmonia axyridis]|uniref:nucleolar protein 6-like n=1 Tax=Harmonia axyridis TaxID=115357 RepID=UPI001E277F9A|nr:nucleolar protein 6-like [Harmonia axyridis]XP_045463297.1 nucleolar protein 6-like [Harmonia axyridis]